MSTHGRPLIGPVLERTTPGSSSVPSSKISRTPETGFPIAQHRLKSVFARAHQEANAKDKTNGSTRIGVPSIVPTQPQPRLIPTAPVVDQIQALIPTDTDALRRQIHQENARVVARMSEDEIEREKQAIFEQLGEGTGELLRRVQAARRRKEVMEEDAHARALMEPKEVLREVQRKVEGTMNNNEVRLKTDHDYVPLVVAPTPRRVSDGLATRPSILRVKSLENMGRPVPSPLPAMSNTRPSSRTGRKLRFAEITPEDVHVYESAPRSPKRSVLALPPPPDAKDDSLVSLGTFRKNAIPLKRPRQANGSPTKVTTLSAERDDEPEEGTPEYIRRRYFPHVPANEPSLSWMDTPSQESTDLSAPRFDLHGAPIPSSLSTSLPSHLGLHHHAEGSRAGYTIDDIFLLARSTVPAQRASMLGILAKISHRLGLQVRYPDSPEKIGTFVGQEGQLRKRILAAGLSAIDQIGSLGARAVEVVWECLVEWDGTRELEGVELVLAPDIVSSLQLEHLLPQITAVLSHAALPSESLAQLLDVVHWFAQLSNPIADMITTTPRLIPTILSTFVLTPIPLKEDSVPPNPAAIQLLITLTLASRANASALLDPADALLRFVTPLPPSSLYPPAFATTLLTYTLRFYAALSSYGFYAHIATTASDIFTALASYVVSSTSVSDSASRQLQIAWAALIEVWTVCATDPHATSPPHEILWSQVCAWEWAADARKLRARLRNNKSDWATYAVAWDAEAAWLGGARVNGIKGGEKEREEALKILGNTFVVQDGAEFRIVQSAIETMQRDLGQACPTAVQDGERVLKSLASAANVLASALRLWLACLPPLSDGTLLSTPPFALPFSDLSALSAMLVKHPVWSLSSTLGATHLQVYVRPLTRFIVHFHRVSYHIPGTTPQLWFAQALVFLSRLLPGDESSALAMVDTFSLVTPQFIGLEPAEMPLGVRVDLLRPFFEYTVQPEREVYVAPLRPNTESIARCSTLRLPPLSPSSSQSSGSGDDDDPNRHLARSFTAGLSLTCDFLFTPLTHLLRSGTSPVFQAPPDDWTASEVDIVRATLLLAYAARKVLVVHGLEGFVHNAAEVVFACMRVCMLEHGVGSGGTDIDVFRDAWVERWMALLLEPFIVRSGSRLVPLPTSTPTHANVRTLEDASAPYLGTTPFYQFYTDLVALYGAVSFGHRTFAALVVTPLAMHYAVDYRQALWCGGDRAASADEGDGTGSGSGAGLGDVVRSVRIPIEDVVCTLGGSADPREYLYPIERDVGVLGAYVAALITRNGGGVDGFLRLVAVHHVACTVWGDGNEEAGEMTSEVEVTRRETRAGMLRAMLGRGEMDVVRDVVLYRQRRPREGAFVWPPACYRGSEGKGVEDAPADGSGAGWRTARVAFVREVFGEGNEIVKRVGALLGVYPAS